MRERMNCLEWEHVWARYGRPWALKDLSLAVEPGCLLAVMGLAGAGKSTLLRVASGGLRVGSGGVWVDGRSAGKDPRAVIAHTRALPDRLCVNKAVGLRVALHAWGLDAYREHRVGTLPASVRARVALAAGWAGQGKVWLLDDPTALLEPAWQEALPDLLRAWLKREGGCVVAATHDPGLGVVADRVAILSKGNLVALDTSAALLAACACEEVVVRTVDAERVACALYENLHLEAERLKDGLRIRVRSAEAALPGILQTLGPRIETVWIRKPTLRDAVRHFSSLPVAPDAPNRPQKR